MKDYTEDELDRMYDTQRDFELDNQEETELESFPTQEEVDR